MKDNIMHELSPVHRRIEPEKKIGKNSQEFVQKNY